MKLKSVGFYREMSHGRSSDPSIHELVDKGDIELKDNICKYLNGGSLVIVSPGEVKDIIEDGTDTIGTGSLLTDGIWVWPDDLEYYVQKYNIELPEEFISSMKTNNWVNPITETDFSDESIEIDGVLLA